MKIAIIHDYLNQYGGAERVLETFLEIWPDADVHTLLYDRHQLPERMHELDVNSSFLNRFPFRKFYYEYLIPFYPLAVERIDTRKYDLVISSSSAWAKGAVTDIKTCHVSYCYNPMRFAWDSFFPLIKQKGFITKGLSFIISMLRIWDAVSSKRPDKYFTISEFVQKRIRKYYNTQADIIYPPVNTDFFKPDTGKRQEEYFLLVSRLKSYKRIDIAIEAFNKLHKPLIIIGEGIEKSALKSMAHSNIQFLSGIDDKTLLSYYQRCRAFVFPSEEDFGIVPLEAQSCGKPVIAYRGGGSMETIIEGETGEFYYPQNADALARTVEGFDHTQYNPETIRANAVKFSKDRFKKEFKAKIELFYNQYKKENIL